MLRLTFDPQGNGERDLTLTFGSHQLFADSYYFAIDRDDVPDATPTARIVRVLQSMLQQWRDAVRKCPPGETIYLPYDFGDEDTGWIEFTAGDKCRLQPGRGRVEGYKVWPTAWRRWEERVPGFEPLASVPEMRMSTGEVLAAIDASLAGLGEPAPSPAA